MEKGTVTAMNTDGFGFIAADRHIGEIWVRPRSTDATTLPLGEAAGRVSARDRHARHRSSERARDRRLTQRACARLQRPRPAIVTTLDL